MVLRSPSICGIRKLISICEEYAKQHGLIYHPKKSDFCQIIGKLVKRETEIKYLVHIVTKNLKDDKDMERECRTLAVRANMLARRFAGWSLPIRIALFKAYCQTFYTSGLWASCTQGAAHVLRVQYNMIQVACRDNLLVVAICLFKFWL